MYAPATGAASGGPLSSGHGPECAGHNPAALGAALKAIGRGAGVGLRASFRLKGKGSTTLEPIHRNKYPEPDRARVQEDAIASAQSRTEVHLAMYVADPRSFGGRYVAADLFKETFAAYAESRESRNRYNAPVHNSAAVLSAEQFRRVLQRADDPARDTVVLLTGIPGAGKTSSVLAGGGLSPDTKAVFEGQLVKPETTIPKVQQVIDAGLRPVIIAVHATPESALRNTLKRFGEEGRGASIKTMADIQGGLAEGLRAVHGHFGDAVELRVYDYRDRNNPRELKGWENVHVLESEGNRERIAQRLGDELERGRAAGEVGDAGYRQASGQAPLPAARPVVQDRDGQHEAHGDRRGLPEVDRAEAFLSLPRPQALRLHPELGPAFAIVDAAKLQLEQRGVAPDKQSVVLDKVRAEVAEQISRRGVQSIVAGRTGPQIDLKR